MTDPDTTRLREQLSSTPTGQALLRGNVLLPVRPADITADAELDSAPDGSVYFYRDGDDRYFVLVDEHEKHEVLVAPVVIPPPPAQNVVISDTEPDDPTLGLVWVDTSDPEHLLLWFARDDGA